MVHRKWYILDEKDKEERWRTTCRMNDKVIEFVEDVKIGRNRRKCFSSISILSYILIFFHLLSFSLSLSFFFSILYRKMKHSMNWMQWLWLQSFFRIWSIKCQQKRESIKEMEAWSLHGERKMIEKRIHAREDCGGGWGYEELNVNWKKSIKFPQKKVQKSRSKQKRR